MRPVRAHLGITAFGTNAWTGAERRRPADARARGGRGQRGALRRPPRTRPLRDRRRDGGRARRDARVRPARGRIRTAFAEEAGTTVLALGSTVGQPYHGGGWEVWAPFDPQYEAGEYEAVIDSARETLEASGYAAPLYNLACCEALAGRTRRRDRPPAGRHREAAEPPRPREGGHRPRPAPGRGGVQGARQLASRVSEFRARRSSGAVPSASLAAVTSRDERSSLTARVKSAEAWRRWAHAS